MQPVSFRKPEQDSLCNAMVNYQAMLDAIRDGMVKKEVAEIPDDSEERSRHLKSFGYYQDASQVGICKLEASMLLDSPIRNPDMGEIGQLVNEIQLDLKCSDGLCGVCKCTVLEGDIEHRDFVLSKAQREESMILCQSRAASASEKIVLDL